MKIILKKKNQNKIHDQIFKLQIFAGLYVLYLNHSGSFWLSLKNFYKTGIVSTIHC